MYKVFICIYIDFKTHMLLFVEEAVELSAVAAYSWAQTRYRADYVYSELGEGLAGASNPCNQIGRTLREPSIIILLYFQSVCVWLYAQPCTVYILKYFFGTRMLSEKFTPPPFKLIGLTGQPL